MLELKLSEISGLSCFDGTASTLSVYDHEGRVVLKTRPFENREKVVLPQPESTVLMPCSSSPVMNNLKQACFTFLLSGTNQAEAHLACEGVVHVSQFTEVGERSLTVPLRCRNQVGNVSLLVYSKWSGSSEAPRNSLPELPMVLGICIVAAKNLPNREHPRSQGSVDPFVQCYDAEGHEVLRTPNAESTINPKWPRRKAFVALPISSLTGVLTFECSDSMTLRNVTLGKAIVSISDALAAAKNRSRGHLEPTTVLLNVPATMKSYSSELLIEFSDVNVVVESSPAPMRTETTESLMATISLSVLSAERILNRHPTNPYVQVFDPSGALVLRTPTIEDSIDPDWRQFPSCTIKFSNLSATPMFSGGSSPMLRLHCHSANVNGTDEFLGEGTLPVKDVIQQYSDGSDVEHNLLLKPRKFEQNEMILKFSEELGIIRIRISIEPRGSLSIPSTHPIHRDSTATVPTADLVPVPPQCKLPSFPVKIRARIFKISNLSPGSDGLRHPFVRVIGPHARELLKTKEPVQGNLNPQWQFGSADAFLEVADSSGSMRFQCWDADVTEDVFLGEAIVSVSDIIAYSVSRTEFVAAPLTKSHTGATMMLNFSFDIETVLVCAPVVQEAIDQCPITHVVLQVLFARAIQFRTVRPYPSVVGVLCIGNSEFSSAAVDKDSSDVWPFEFAVTCPLPPKQIICFKVFDADDDPATSTVLPLGMCASEWENLTAENQTPLPLVDTFNRTTGNLWLTATRIHAVNAKTFKIEIRDGREFAQPFGEMIECAVVIEDSEYISRSVSSTNAPFFGATFEHSLKRERLAPRPVQISVRQKVTGAILGSASLSISDAQVSNNDLHVKSKANDTSKWVTLRTLNGAPAGIVFVRWMISSPNDVPFEQRTIGIKIPTAVVDIAGVRSQHAVTIENIGLKVNGELQSTKFPFFETDAEKEVPLVAGWVFPSDETAEVSVGLLLRSGELLEWNWAEIPFLELADHSSWIPFKDCGINLFVRRGFSVKPDSTSKVPEMVVNFLERSLFIRVHDAVVPPGFSIPKKSRLGLSIKHARYMALDVIEGTLSEEEKPISSSKWIFDTGLLLRRDDLAHCSENRRLSPVEILIFDRNATQSTPLRFVLLVSYARIGQQNICLENGAVLNCEWIWLDGVASDAPQMPGYAAVALLTVKDLMPTISPATSHVIAKIQVDDCFCWTEPQSFSRKILQWNPIHHYHFAVGRSSNAKVSLHSFSCHAGFSVNAKDIDSLVGPTLGQCSFSVSGSGRGQQWSILKSNNQSGVRAIGNLLVEVISCPAKEKLAPLTTNDPRTNARARSADGLPVIVEGPVGKPFLGHLKEEEPIGILLPLLKSHFGIAESDQSLTFKGRKISVTGTMQDNRCKTDFQDAPTRLTLVHVNSRLISIQCKLPSGAVTPLHVLPTISVRDLKKEIAQQAGSTTADRLLGRGDPAGELQVVHNFAEMRNEDTLHNIKTGAAFVVLHKPNSAPDFPRLRCKLPPASGPQMTTTPPTTVEVSFEKSLGDVMTVTQPFSHTLRDLRRTAAAIGFSQHVITKFAIVVNGTSFTAAEEKQTLKQVSGTAKHLHVRFCQEEREIPFQVRLVMPDSNIRTLTVRPDDRILDLRKTIGAEHKNHYFFFQDTHVTDENQHIESFVHPPTFAIRAAPSLSKNDTLEQRLQKATAALQSAEAEIAGLHQSRARESEFKQTCLKLEQEICFFRRREKDYIQRIEELELALQRNQNLLQRVFNASNTDKNH